MQAIRRLPRGPDRTALAVAILGHALLLAALFAWKGTVPHPAVEPVVTHVTLIPIPRPAPPAMTMPAGSGAPTAPSASVPRSAAPRNAISTSRAASAPGALPPCPPIGAEEGRPALPARPDCDAARRPADRAPDLILPGMPRFDADGRSTGDAPRPDFGGRPSEAEIDAGRARDLKVLSQSFGQAAKPPPAAYEQDRIPLAGGEPWQQIERRFDQILGDGRPPANQALERDLLR